MAVVLATGCARDAGPSAEELAYEFRDIYPVPAITGSGAEGESEMLRPLHSGYLTYISGEDFDGAAAEFARVGKAHPELIEADLLQGISLVLAGRSAEAVPVLQAVVESHGHFPPARWFLAQALFSEGRGAEAMEQMNEVRLLNEDYAAEATQIVEAHARRSR
jgi:hypothetical protein